MTEFTHHEEEIERKCKAIEQLAHERSMVNLNAEMKFALRNIVSIDDSILGQAEWHERLEYAIAYAEGIVKTLNAKGDEPNDYVPYSTFDAPFVSPPGYRTMMDGSVITDEEFQGRLNRRNGSAAS